MGEGSGANMSIHSWLVRTERHVVLRWRQEQEAALLGRPLLDTERAGIARFVQHFERITRHMMAGGVRADIIVRQDEERRVVSVTRAVGGAI